MNRKERRLGEKRARKEKGGSPAARAAFRAATQALDGGRVDEAVLALERLIEDHPRHAEALHLLGLVRYDAGRFEEAADLILRATEADGAKAEYHANCGAVMNMLGRFAEAEAACRHAIELEPGNAGAHNNLSVALVSQGKTEEALATLERALRLDPGSAEAHVNLGNLLFKEGRAAAAAAAYRAALGARPDHAIALANLGAALRELGELAEAERCCRRAIDARAGYPEAHNTLGTVLNAAGEPEAAVTAFDEAIRLRPRFPEAHMNKGAALFQAGALADAEAAYRSALVLYPRYPEAQNGLGVVLLAAARLDEAVAAFRKALDLKPSYGEAAYNLAASGALDADAAAVAALEERVRDPSLAAGERIRLHFALGEIRDRRGETDAAFAHFEAGNGLRRAEQAARGLVFRADAHERLIERIERVFTREFLASRRDLGDADGRPAFIVGMPRSGTTLVEQIAASHPSVFGAGEPGLVARLAGGLYGGYPEGALALDRGGAAALAGAYLDRLARGAGPAVRIADKTPFNFLYLGLIETLFPGARVVHCRRRAVDVGVSCYFQDFRAPHPWSTDLADIGRYVRAYERMMAHWRGALSLPMIEVDYESLVADLEAEARRLVEFLGLDWNPACLDFHENPRAVTTASNWQVRKPVYATSVGRARAYERFLAPLKDALGT